MKVLKMFEVPKYVKIFPVLSCIIRFCYILNMIFFLKESPQGFNQCSQVFCRNPWPGEETMLTQSTFLISKDEINVFFFPGAKHEHPWPQNIDPCFSKYYV